MTQEKLVKTNCRFCGYQCGLTATVTDGRVTAVEPDPTQYPGDAGIQRGCRRWRVAPEFLDHPQRINYPLKRVGERGSGQWQRITWDQALDEIAAKLATLKERHGPEMLATCIGGPHAVFWPLHRFMNLFGSPNNVGIGQICWNPATWVNALTYGWTIENELDPEKTACAMFWGTNPAESDNSLLWRTLVRFSQTGKPLIVVDPRRTRTAELATLWLPVRPGTDAVLALGLINVIVAERLYDETFVDRWCNGFARLAEHVARYTPAYVESVTGIKAETVVAAARLYAGNAPATLISGRGIDQIGANSFATQRGLAIMRAITGNLDTPGASHITDMPDFIPEIDLELSDRFPAEARQKRLGSLALQSYPGYERVRRLTMRHGRRLPMRYLTSAQPNLVWRAMLTGEPYPIRSLIVMATNPLLTQADSRLIYDALKSLDLLVVLEMFPTPTTMLADYVLPSAGALERPLLETKAGTANLAYGGAKAVEPYYERRPDYDFWRGIGLRLGQENDWPWQSFEAALAASMEPTGWTWDDFCREGLYTLPPEYRKHEHIDPQTGQPAGFATASGKVELYCGLVAELGGDPLPVPQPTPATSEEYPLSLITGARFQPYFASSFRQFASLRSAHPEPWAEVSVATARRLGLEDGCRVWVETERGRASFTLRIARMGDGVVSVEYGWWYPEMAAAEPSIGGLWAANANTLTNADYETSDPMIGTATYNGLPCRVSRAE
ncbi:molybdopterin-dependent oxidoreductase [Anaeroselena agilis]|uniref:Molybdopterin-dependent oxidoreductase n=1 Tax=Anaeroselena agilis TaxID=3063788 RepID=A0ABU3NSN6_9FIRM|nr:molybdopterin-dependent oxidoreductase [Selenomonadales bacterium 4137-cl]